MSVAIEKSGFFSFKLKNSNFIRGKCLQKCTFTKNEFSQARIGVKTSFKSLITHDNILQWSLLLFLTHRYILGPILRAKNDQKRQKLAFSPSKLRVKKYRYIINKDRNNWRLLSWVLSDLNEVLTPILARENSF